MPSSATVFVVCWSFFVGLHLGRQEMWIMNVVAVAHAVCVLQKHS